MRDLNWLRLLLVLITLAACAAPRQREAAPTSAAGSTRVTDLGTLRWIEGRWRGTLPDGGFFFEGYRFANDSTILTYTYPDSTSLTPSDSGAIMLRGGVVATGSGGSRWIATALREGFVRFDPREGARNNFVWERLSDDAWRAILLWPATADRPAREVVYPMRRLRR